MLALPDFAKASGMTVHLCGDSLFKGWALGKYPSDVSLDDPLYPFRSLSSMAALVFEENAMPVDFVYSDLTFSHWPDFLEEYVARYVRDRDWVIFEEAGPHINSMAEYRERLLQAHSIASAARASVAFSTMFYYGAAPSYEYDPEPNATTRQVAEETESLLIDFKTSMDVWRANAQSVDRVAVMHADNTHGNVWGQMRMLGDIFKALDLRKRINSCKTLEAAASANYRALRYGGNSNWSARRAVVYVRYLIMHARPQAIVND